MMKSKDKTFRQLLEQVREYDDLIVLPDEIKFNTRTKNNASINNLRRAVEDFNKFPNDKDSLMKLKRAFNNAMTVIIELLDDISRDLNNYNLEFRIQELESKFSRDLSEATFNELKDLKKKQNIN